MWRGYMTLSPVKCPIFVKYFQFVKLLRLTRVQGWPLINHFAPSNNLLQAASTTLRALHGRLKLHQTGRGGASSPSAGAASSCRPFLFCPLPGAQSAKMRRVSEKTTNNRNLILL